MGRAVPDPAGPGATATVAAADGAADTDADGIADAEATAGGAVSATVGTAEVAIAAALTAVADDPPVAGADGPSRVVQINVAMSPTTLMLAASTAQRKPLPLERLPGDVHDACVVGLRIGLGPEGASLVDDENGTGVADGNAGAGVGADAENDPPDGVDAEGTPPAGVANDGIEPRADGGIPGGNIPGGGVPASTSPGGGVRGEASPPTGVGADGDSPVKIGGGTAAYAPVMRAAAYIPDTCAANGANGASAARRSDAEANRCAGSFSRQ